MNLFLLNGEVTPSVLSFLFSAEFSRYEKQAKTDGALCIYPMSLKPRSFYGLLMRLPNFPMVAAVGRWKAISLERHVDYVKVPLSGPDAEAFEKIVGISNDDIDRILKEKSLLARSPSAA